MASTNDMTVGNPTGDIIKFALPLVLGYILQQMYLVIDAAIVGRWVGVNALAAVGASSSVMFLVMGFCNGACAGFAIPVAQTFGAKNFSKMRAYVANSIRIAVVMALVITILSSALCERILKMLNTPGEILTDAWWFLLMNFLAIPFTMGYNLLSGFIRALGNSKQPFYFLIISSVVNIVLDVLLILVCGMGVEGAGLATLISQACSVCLCLRYIYRQLQEIIPQGSEWEYHDNMVGHLLNNGVPMGLQFSITGIGIIMLQSANNALGTAYVAAFTASMRIKYLFTCVFDNVGLAMATYCGQNIGARKLDRISLGMKSAVKIMMVYAAISFLIIYPLADYMMMLFVGSDKHDIVEYASQFMRINNYFFCTLGILCTFRYSIQGLGFSNLSMMSGVMEMIARSAVSLWVVPAFGFLGVCFGDPMAWVAADLFLVPAYIFVYRLLKRRLAVPQTQTC